MNSLRFRYQTKEFGDTDIHLRTLRDLQEYLDSEGIAEKLGISSANWSLFGVVWESGEVLARHMHQFEIKDKRILEIGCGIGLASLVLNHREANITATDYHPEAGNFLAENTKLNNDKEIPFVRTDWNEKNSKLGKFDLIIGSDLLYERDHAKTVSKFIQHHSNDDCEVIVVDPGRGHINQFANEMIVLGFEHTKARPVKMDFLKTPYKGFIHHFIRKDEIKKGEL